MVAEVRPHLRPAEFRPAFFCVLMLRRMRVVLYDGNRGGGIGLARGGTFATRKLDTVPAAGAVVRACHTTQQAVAVRENI